MNISGNVDNPEGTMDALMQIAVCPKVGNHNYLFGLSAYHPYSVILNFEHLCSLNNFCEEIKVILRFNTLLSKDEIGNLRLISCRIYSKRSD